MKSIDSSDECPSSFIKVGAIPNVPNLRESGCNISLPFRDTIS
jgi:hypothetical protein